MAQVEAVVFDVDGTLIDSVDLHAEAWRRALAHFGHDVPFDRVRGQIGKGGDQLMPVFLPREELARRGEEIDRFRADLYRREFLPRARAFPEVRPLFERLRAAGRRLALASSAKGQELETYLRLAGIGDLLDAQTTSEDAAQSKPHPDIFQAALDRLGVAAERAVVVGDSPYDAEAAGRAGMRCVGVLCGGFPEAELRAAGCIAIYRDPAGLLARLDTSPLMA